MQVCPGNAKYVLESYSDSLAPGEAVWKEIGPSPDLGRGAVAVTAYGESGFPTSPLPTYVLKVDDVNVTVTVTALEILHTVGFNVTNNGDTTVELWGVILGWIG